MYFNETRARHVFLVITFDPYIFITPHTQNLAFIVNNTYIQYLDALNPCRSRLSADRQTHTNRPTIYCNLRSACAKGYMIHCYNIPEQSL